jgi:hypothetical protein
MSTTKSSSTGSTFTVVSALGDTGTLTVRSPTGETVEVRTFADEGVRERCKTLAPGSTARLEIAADADEPTVLGLGPAAPSGPFGAD